MDPTPHAIGDVPTAEPEVYETSDVEEDLGVFQRDEANPDIEISGLDVGGAARRFNKNTVIGELNFDSVSDRTLLDAGYKVYYTEETVDQKLSRIARELHEIKLADPGEATADELIALAEKMGSKKETNADFYSERVKQLLKSTTEQLEVNEVAPTGTNLDALLELESKIAQLEEKVGGGLVTGSQNSVDNILNDIDRKLQIIENPDYNLSKIKNTLNDLVQQQELFEKNQQAAVYSQSSIEAYKSSKIDELVRYLPELSSFEKKAPLILQRLQQLNSVHSQIAHSVDFVGQIDAILSNLAQEINNWERTLDEVNGKLDTNADLFESNKAHIEASLAKLQARLDAI